MKKFKLLKLILLFLFVLNSCGTVREGFQNPKKNSSDEFLVEKKSPLVIPPEFDQLPLPKSENNNEINNQEDDSQLQEILTQSSKTIDESNKSSENQKNRSLEDNLLKKIRK